jgi:hypothetical protein
MLPVVIELQSAVCFSFGFQGNSRHWVHGFSLSRKAERRVESDVLDSALCLSHHSGVTLAVTAEGLTQ